MAYDNKNSGMLARNERKEKDNHPDFTGQCDIEGRQYWVSGWIKVGKQGSKMEGKRFFSLSFKPKDAAAAPAQGGSPTSAPARPSRAAPAAAPAQAAPTQLPLAKPQENEDEDVPF
jgi:hypothetical protein